MKGTLFSADFVKDTSGDLRLLELNTDTDFWSSSLAQVDFTDFFSVLSSNSIDTIDIIYKPGHSEFVNHLSHSAQSQPNITSFIKHEEDISTIYPTAVEDADNKFILRLAYDESAIFDSTYCKNSLELHKLFVDAVEGDLVPPMYISSSEFMHNSIEPSLNSDNVPDLVIKKNDSLHEPLNFHKIELLESQSEDDAFSNFIDTNYSDSDILMNYIDSGDTSHSSIRSFNIIYGSNLDIINLTTLEPVAVFEKPETLSKTGTLVDTKHYYEFTTNYPKYSSNESYGGVFEEEMISDANGNPVQVSNVQVGNSYKSFYIEGTPNTDNISVFTEWSYSGQTLPSGSYVTSSVLINSLEQQLPNNLVSHLHYGTGSFRTSGAQHILIYDSLEDKIRYEEVAGIIPGTHKVFKLDGTLIDITANDFEILNENGLSTYILDLEETDTFALHDNDINIKIVTHNCFPEGTRILLEDGSYKNIEDLTTSDVLMTYDNDKEKYGKGSASSIRESIQDKLIHISTENGEEIKSTPLHRFYVEEKGWIHAEKIEVGDLLFNKDGIFVKVKSLDVLSGEFKVYHIIDVKGDHTYFAENILVHNFKLMPTCFSAGTRITISDHSEKFIEEVEVGDEVFGWDGEKLVPAKVIAIDSEHKVGDHAERCKVLGDMPSLYTIDETGIEFTPEHPFLTKDGWKSVSPDPGQEPFKSQQEPKVLRPGDEINIRGEWTPIHEIRVVRSNPDETVYNITVEGVHSYIAEGIIVHNK
jgi:hypothetical protein